MKRTRLKRGAPLRRGKPLRVRAPLRRKTPLRQVSAKKRKELRDSRPVVAEVFARDGGCVLRDRTDEWGPCDGPLDPHHILRQSAGGKWVPAHLLTLCRIHHNWVGDHPEAATAQGLSVPQATELPEAYRLRELHGIGAGTYPGDIESEAS